MLLSVDGKLSAAKSAHQIKKMALPFIEVDDPRFKRPRNVVFFSRLHHDWAPFFVSALSKAEQTRKKDTVDSAGSWGRQPTFFFFFQSDQKSKETQIN